MKKLNKNQKVLIAIISVVIVAIITTSLISARKRKIMESKVLGDQDKDSIHPFSPTPTNVQQVVYPLKRGAGYTIPAENTVVKIVQKWLNSKIIDMGLKVSMLNVDGKFGPLTEGVLYKVKGVKTVSYTLYKSIETELRNVSPLLV